MIQSARASPKWNDAVQVVKKKAKGVGSDLESIWKSLEQGRLEWIQAVNNAHPIKDFLKNALTKGAAAEKKASSNQQTILDGDISDAKMIWIYGLSLNITALQQATNSWAKIVRMSNPTEPLVGYQPELWDPRLDEWRVLDLGIQAVAEQG